MKSGYSADMRFARTVIDDSEKMTQKRGKTDIRKYFMTMQVWLRENPRSHQQAYHRRIDDRLYLLPFVLNGR